MNNINETQRKTCWFIIPF